ncbi:MAG: HEAT repeat domain-containing protein, partial [Acidobacteria bacterium]|nr:HEAT repeat domain-containing protein [Acidobacteriota bacterium]
VCEALEDADPTVRERAFTALALQPRLPLSDGTLSSVKSGLFDGDRHIRQLAAHILGPRAGADVAALVAGALPLEDDASVRGDLFETLASRPAADAAGALVAGLDSTDRDTRVAASRGLGRLGGEPALAALVAFLCRALVDPESHSRMVAGGRSIVLRQYGSDVPAAIAAIKAAGEGRAVELLCGRLRRPEADVRWGAALALRNFAARSAAEPLIAALATDGDPRVRAAAAEALAILGDARAVGPLVDAFGECAAPAATPLCESIDWSLGKLARIEPMPPAAVREWWERNREFFPAAP